MVRGPLPVSRPVVSPTSAPWPLQLPCGATLAIRSRSSSVQTVHLGRARAHAQGAAAACCPCGQGSLSPGRASRPNSPSQHPTSRPKSTTTGAQRVLPCPPTITSAPRHYGLSPEHWPTRCCEPRGASARCFLYPRAKRAPLCSNPFLAPKT